MLILLSSTSPTPSTHQKHCSKCCGPSSRAFSFCAMPCFPPSGRIHRETAPLMSRHTEQIPALQWLSRAVGGTPYLSFPSCRCLFYFHKSFQRGHFLRSSLSHKKSSLLFAFISVRRKEDLLPQSLCLLAFKSTESGDMCLHPTPALCKSHFQVICSSTLFQSLFGLIFFFFFVGAWSKEAFKICP